MQEMEVGATHRESRRCGNWTTRGLDNSRTSQLADWTSRGLDNSLSRRCRQKGKLITQSRRWHPRVVQSATCPVRELSSPRLDQSARCPVRESSSPRVGNPRVGVSASCPVTAGAVPWSTLCRLRRVRRGELCWTFPASVGRRRGQVRCPRPSAVRSTPCCRGVVDIGGFNGWPHVQWPTRPLPKEAPEAPREVCSGGP